MNPAAQLIAEDLVHEAVLGDPGKAVECRREDDGIEVVPVPSNVRRGPRDSGLDAGLQLFGRGGCGAG